jgi:hypothetical protein
MICAAVGVFAVVPSELESVSLSDLFDEYFAVEVYSLFPDEITLPHDYEALEERFLDFAKAIKVRSSLRDAVMSAEMRAGVPMP